MTIEAKAGVIGYTKRPLAPESRAWDAAAEMAKAKTPEAWKAMCTWFDSAKPDEKGSYKLPHHGGEASYPTIFRGVVAGMGRLHSTNMPAGDRKGCYNHLASHYRDFKKEPPKWSARAVTATEAERAFIGGFLEGADVDADPNATLTAALAATARVFGWQEEDDKLPED